jgi:hypothetical protein
VQDKNSKKLKQTKIGAEENVESWVNVHAKFIQLIK